MCADWAWGLLGLLFKTGFTLDTEVPQSTMQQKSQQARALSFTPEVYFATLVDELSPQLLSTQTSVV